MRGSQEPDSTLAAGHMLPSPGHMSSSDATRQGSWHLPTLAVWWTPTANSKAQHTCSGLSDTSAPRCLLYLSPRMFQMDKRNEANFPLCATNESQEVNPTEKWLMAALFIHH